MRWQWTLFFGAVAPVSLVAAACSIDRGVSPIEFDVRSPQADALAALGMEAVCNSITPEQKESFGIERVEWKTSDGPIGFPHCKILSSVATSGAVFAGNYQLTDFNENDPSVALSRIACTPTTRVSHTIIVPGGSTDWTGMLGANAFNNLGRPASGCIAVTTTKHFSTIDTRYLPPNSGLDFLTGLHAVVQNADAMMQALFLKEMSFPEDERLTGCVAVSAGGLLGLQLMDDWNSLPCDGVLHAVSGDGFVPSLELDRTMCFGDRKIPLTRRDAVLNCSASSFANEFGIFDKDFREEVLRVLAAEGEEAALALIRAYDISTASPVAQRLARRLTPTGALIRPTIVIHGTHDDQVPAFLSLQYVSRVIANGRQPLLRFYLVPGLDHDQTVGLAALRAGQLLLKWTTGEAEPHDLVISVPGVGTVTVKNSKDAGFENDPCGYFDFIVGFAACVGSGLFPPLH